MPLSINPPSILKHVSFENGAMLILKHGLCLSPRTCHLLRMFSRRAVWHLAVQAGRRKLEDIVIYCLFSYLISFLLISFYCLSFYIFLPVDVSLFQYVFWAALVPIQSFHRCSKVPTVQNSGAAKCQNTTLQNWKPSPGVQILLYIYICPLVFLLMAMDN